jgi:predicted transcriptional regulator
MQQLVLDIRNDKDADLIKELLKRFKSVEVNSFSTTLTSEQLQKRIEEGLKDAAEGNVKPWKQVKAQLLKRIKSGDK